jgi:CBS domain-containing protein
MISLPEEAVMTSLTQLPIEIADQAETADQPVIADQPVVALMSQPVFAIPADASLEDAVRALLRSGLRHVVAVDPAGRFAGVFSARQVAAAWARDPHSLAAVPVGSMLDACPPTVAQVATLRTVAQVMRDHRTDIVVVVDPDRYALGVVTAGDVVAVVAGSGRRASVES